MRIDFVTLFPEMIEQAVGHSILHRAVQMEAVAFSTSNPRDFATDIHRKVDDSSYGGGPGMVMMAPLIEMAVQGLSPSDSTAIILLDAAGTPYQQSDAMSLATREHLILICGRYEGVDERVRSHIATHCFSVGDYVVTGGELPALVVADSVTRLLPGVLGNEESHADDSFVDGLLGFPLYTKPPVFHGEEVPEVLRSGHHAQIAKWRRTMQLKRTKSIRPDLFEKFDLTEEDRDLL